MIKRLQEERKRLGLTQDKIAEIGGVKRRTQINYEAGERCPDANYFIAIAAVGADVQYILTGIRSGNQPGTRMLYQEQSALLAGWERCTPVNKNALLLMIENAAQAVQDQPKPATNERPAVMLQSTQGTDSPPSSLLHNKPAADMRGYVRWRSLWVPGMIFNKLPDDGQERRLSSRRAMERRGSNH